MKPSLYLIFFLMLFFSCTRVDDELIFKPIHPIRKTKFRIYRIPKGEHYSDGNVFQLLQQAELRFEASFDSSAIYQTKIASNQYDINKLYGFSDCQTPHHENSARFGWRWNGTVIELHAYCYSGTQRTSLLLDSLAISEVAELSITLRPLAYIFEVNRKKYSIPRPCSSLAIPGYKLYPYFGGDEPAPHDISISIKDL